MAWWWCEFSINYRSFLTTMIVKILATNAKEIDFLILTNCYSPSLCFCSLEWSTVHFDSHWAMSEWLLPCISAEQWLQFYLLSCILSYGQNFSMLALFMFWIWCFFVRESCLQITAASLSYAHRCLSYPLQSCQPNLSPEINEGDLFLCVLWVLKIHSICKFQI